MGTPCRRHTQARTYVHMLVSGTRTHTCARTEHGSADSAPPAVTRGQASFLTGEKTEAQRGLAGRWGPGQGPAAPAPGSLRPIPHPPRHSLGGFQAASAHPAVSLTLTSCPVHPDRPFNQSTRMLGSCARLAVWCARSADPGPACAPDRQGSGCGGGAWPCQGLKAAGADPAGRRGHC